MKVIVTGGNGFLGSHLVHWLVKSQIPCLVLSRHFDRLADVFQSIQFCTLTGGYAEHAGQIQAFAPTHIVHLAWEGGNAYKDVNDVQQFYSNIPDGIDLLRILASLSVRPRFVGVGSFAEYGRLTAPACETQSDAPVTLYGVAKSTFKTLSRKFCEDHDIAWTWIRPCYIYGPNDVPTRLIPRVAQTLLNHAIVSLDSCGGTIDYLYVADFSSAVAKILETNATGVFNVCSGEECRVRDVVDIIARQTNATSLLEYTQVSERGMTSIYMCGNNARLRAIGWSPTVSLEVGINNVIQALCATGGILELAPNRRI